jgi:hypothetical protein
MVSTCQVYLVFYACVAALALTVMTVRGSRHRLLFVLGFLLVSDITIFVEAARLLTVARLKAHSHWEHEEYVAFHYRAANWGIVAGFAVNIVAVALSSWLRPSWLAVLLFSLALFFCAVGMGSSSPQVALCFIFLYCMATFFRLHSPRFSTDRDTRTHWSFAKRPRRSIADWRDGEVAVMVGKVLECEAPIRARYSRRMSVCAEHVVETLPYGQSFWVERERQVAATDFTIADASGQALVMAAGLEVLLIKDYSAEWDGSGAQIRQREGIVDVGETVAVLGRGNREPDPRPSKMAGYRDRPTIVVVRGARRQRLLVSDSPGIVGGAG